MIGPASNRPDPSANPPSDAYEQSLSAAAARRGLLLLKCPHADPAAPQHGTYEQINRPPGSLVFGNRQAGYGRTLPQIEKFLRELPKRQQRGGEK